MLYTGLIKSNSWPVIANSIPQSNNVSSRNVNYDRNQRAAQVIDTNAQDNEATPLPVEDSDNNVSPIALPPSIWKFLKSANPNQEIKIKERTYWFCNKYYC